MELNALIAECTAYDFKVMLEEKKPKSWLKSISAFANGLGGSLFFGIENDGIVKGLDNVQNVCETISSKIRDDMDPLPEVEILPHNIDDLHILQLKVHAGHYTPYYYVGDGQRIAFVRVGDEIAERLEKSGFKVIHDKTIYDASYNGAYGRSLKNVEKILEENPSIVITLDVHRDAIHYDSGTRCKPTAEINGKKAAQVMIISGAEEGEIEDYPDWAQNLTFAIALQNKVEENYKGLMRPLFFCQRKYNMHVTPCSLLLEMGTDANTLEEAVYSGRLIGDSLAELLEENM